jgi:FKBP-type peptidyl-prolyl cis-trans isomerase FkpA
MIKFMPRAIALLVLTAAACGGAAPENESGIKAGDGVSTIATLQTIDRTVGGGTEATPGREVTVHYTGWLYNATAPDNRGTKFDSSRDRGKPFPFRLGGGDVIRGWDEGVAGMRIGGVRTLIIPPDLGYGAQGAGGDIPPNATLVFEVELLDVR